MKMDSKHREDAMLAAWRFGRKDAREGKPERSAAVLAILPTQDERDAYVAAYRAERKRLTGAA